MLYAAAMSLHGNVRNESTNGAQLSCSSSACPPSPWVSTLFFLSIHPRLAPVAEGLGSISCSSLEVISCGDVAFGYRGGLVLHLVLASIAVSVDAVVVVVVVVIVVVVIIVVVAVDAPLMGRVHGSCGRQPTTL